MAKVITFSRVFPKGHISEGANTQFVEKILRGLGVYNYRSDAYFQKLLKLNTVNLFKGKLTYNDLEKFMYSLKETTLLTKEHTIRANKRFSKGDVFSPRVWLDKPYNSPMVIFWDDLEVKYCPEFKSDISYNWLVDKKPLSSIDRITLCVNDGLGYKDMLSWFHKPIYGQIVCWTDGVKYNVNHNHRWK